jgi:hypothetical protein
MLVGGDGDCKVFLPHSGFEWRFKVPGRGGEANVAKRTAVGGCLPILVGILVRGSTRPAISIRIMTLHAYIIVVRNSVALGACRRTRWKYMSYLGLVDQ